MTGGFCVAAKPLAYARGSERSHDRKGVVCRKSMSSHGLRYVSTMKKGPV